MAWRGAARRGEARQGKEQGRARHGVARRGVARHGKARNMARRGMARRGQARQGTARNEGAIKRKQQEETMEDLYLGLDMNSLSPGSVITSDELKKLWHENTRPESRGEFWAFVLKLKSDITNYKFKNGEPCAVRQKRGDLHIIQGAEMSEYCDGRIEAGIKQAAKNTILLDTVQRDAMTPEQIQEHERRLFAASTQLSALETTRRMLGLNSGTLKVFAQLRSDEE